MSDPKSFPSMDGSQQENQAAGDAVPPRILVVDDDELVLVVIRKLLEAENCTAEVFTSPRSALAKLEADHFDAILCDVLMPEMSGIEFYQKIRKDFPEYQRRVIFATGDLVSETTWEFIEERHLPYLLKPFSRVEIHRKLLEIVGERLVPPAPPVAKPSWDGVERRRFRRIPTTAKTKIRRKEWERAEPDFPTLCDASRDGVLFVSDREYRVGTQLWVTSHYTGWESDIEQVGFVIRVEKRTDGKWGVAVALGEAAEAARLKFECSSDDSRQHNILANTGETATKSLPLSDMESASRAEDEARRLKRELEELKSTHDRVIDQRDRMADQESQIKKQLEELAKAKGALDETVDGLKLQMESLKVDLASTEEIRYQATHDSLTGVWNRAAIMDLLKGELQRAQREGTSVGTIMADIDHFKSVNDVHGHPAGDAVLQEVAQRISSSVRSYDFVGRYGGEEFLIVLPGCDTDAAPHAERIRAGVSAKPVSIGEEAIPVTLSLGAAVSNEVMYNSAEAIIRGADAALYRAKRAGRNRVETA